MARRWVRAMMVAAIVAVGASLTACATEPAVNRVDDGGTSATVLGEPYRSWVLGFDGLGPVKLGMTVDEASAAAGSTFRATSPTCATNSQAENGWSPLNWVSLGFSPDDGRIVSIRVDNMAWVSFVLPSTATGIRPVDSYEQLTEAYADLRPIDLPDDRDYEGITAADGRVLVFGIGPYEDSSELAVYDMTAATSASTALACRASGGR